MSHLTHISFEFSKNIEKNQLNRGCTLAISKKLHLIQDKLLQCYKEGHLFAKMEVTQSALLSGNGHNFRGYQMIFLMLFFLALPMKTILCKI
ncbi:hypothetical protein P618_200399 [Holospora obtusa F1]|uniref:Uncharacterized protein n=1 Tax=Holospora obtusa F1 TaxID=1399147 RepID=W6TEV5_HOLOB|nr:hypothetical protein P618_200399 [Holospora obtusa F1]